MMNVKKSLKIGLSVVCVSLLLSACGGGGGSSDGTTSDSGNSGKSNTPVVKKKDNKKTSEINKAEDEKRKKENTPTSRVVMDTTSPEFLGLLATGAESIADYDDGYYKRGKKRTFTEKGDTVIDNVTGLQWQGDITFTDCSKLNLAGHSDWRRPNTYEIASIVFLSSELYPFADSYQGSGGNNKDRCVR